MGSAVTVLREGLRALGVREGSIAMAHVSMREIGGRAEALLDALLAVLGERGTLLVYVDYQSTAAVPHFDPERSPASVDYGVFAEIARQHPLAVRSRNPGASMVAIGARAEWLCADHPLRYGYGPGSPLGKLVDAQGDVLLLGSDFDHVSLLHYAEHVARIPGKRVVTSEVATCDGKVHIEEFETSEPVVAAMPKDYFAQVTRAFIASGAAGEAEVGGARSQRLPAENFVDFALTKMERELG